MKKRMLLLNWMVFLSVIPVQVEAQDAESYLWQNVVIRGGGFVTGRSNFCPDRHGRCVPLE
jgi:hypothetical protein